MAGRLVSTCADYTRLSKKCNMPIFTKLLLAVIWLGCIICVYNLAEFIGLAFNFFIVYLVLRSAASLIANKAEGGHSAPLTAKTVG